MLRSPRAGDLQRSFLIGAMEKRDAARHLYMYSMPPMPACWSIAASLSISDISFGISWMSASVVRTSPEIEAEFSSADNVTCAESTT